MSRLSDLVKRFPPASHNLSPTTLERSITGITHRPEWLRTNDLFVDFRLNKLGNPGKPGSSMENITLCSHPSSGPHLCYADIGGISQKVAQYLHTPDISKLDLTAVTGTNGKSSIVHFCRQLSDHCEPQKSAASLGTLGLQSRNRNSKTFNTTPFPLDLFHHLLEASGWGVSRVFLEASSHGLKQNRLAGLDIDTAIFSPITRDHMDYHLDIDDYVSSKLILANLARNNIILSLGCAHAPRILEHLRRKRPQARTVTVDPTLPAADWHFADIVPDETGFEARLSTGHATYAIHIPLLGRFNLNNLLLSMASLATSGLPAGDLCSAASALLPAAGRMQRLNLNLPGYVYIDYAHTPDALEKSLQALREHHPGARVRVLFGCGGDRDRGKRPLMGAVASRLADGIVLCNDNPRSENALAILSEISSGVSLQYVVVIPDRREAIHTSLRGQQDNNVLLLAGKGHEAVQIFSDHTEIFHDETVCHEIA